ncbi:type 1 periplasmic binding fold superfamily protein [uncultured Tenacibaculum sp.]|uniref:type 1 periplasmic binding fold superfamily protein n=1 Tax=uncultured Tenacibaculum sp. TaxID=174713 RepID=UPI002612A85B|nr:type 1 periplasmic binding fold superfamily protein [uncultured Tenacibaculum sp.]
MKSIKLLAFLFISTLVFTGCSDDETPEQVNEEEVITTMTITLTPNGGGTAIVLQTQDLDGDGPNAPVITPANATLAANTVYNGSIVILNETESPAEDITEEIEEEADEHQFFFTAVGPNIAFNYEAPNDSNDNPVGLNFNLVAGAASTGTITVTLKHEPTKPNNGLVEQAGGETDIEATFNVTIQ